MCDNEDNLTISVNFKYLVISSIKDFGKVKRVFRFPSAIFFTYFNRCLPAMLKTAV